MVVHLITAHHFLESDISLVLSNCMHKLIGCLDGTLRFSNGLVLFDLIDVATKPMTRTFRGEKPLINYTLIHSSLAVERIVVIVSRGITSLLRHRSAE